MPHDIVVMGASAGGLEALSTVLSGLSETLPASLFIVLHQPDEGLNRLPDLFNRSGSLPAAYASHEEPIRRGRIYLAPPGRHLLLAGRQIHLQSGPTENGHRPSIDVLFRSAATVYGPRVIGVVLSGALDDGTAGLRAIKARGGLAVVQDPAEAFARGMPDSACANVAVDHIVSITTIADLLQQLTLNGGTVATPAGPAVDPEQEAHIQLHPDEAIPPNAPPSGFACPACQGGLFELQDGEWVRYRCRIGHAYSPEHLLAQHDGATERAGWAAVRALEEDAAMARRMAKRAQDRRFLALATRLETRAVEKAALAGALRTLMLEILGRSDTSAD